MKKKLKWIILCHIFLPFQALAQMHTDDMNYWIEKYQSVSYPLKSIHISSSYGKRADPFTGKGRFHQGIDLEAKYEVVFAMFDAEIKRVGYDPMSGNFITLKAGNYTISYCHLSEIWVKEDELVYAGQELGRSGSTGRATGPHLHISCRLHGKIENPYHLLTFVRDTQLKAVDAVGLNKDVKLSPEDFLRTYAPQAMHQQRKYGIPASVILSQMAFESGWGTSKLARSGHNFFGIKASSRWIEKGLPYSIHDDDRENEKFCNFSSPEESMEYHSRLLMSERYRRCHQYAPTDHKNWLRGIKAAGYATNIHYVRSCEKIINRYKLYKYDYLAYKT